MIKRFDILIEVFSHYRQRFLDNADIHLSSLKKKSALNMKQKVLTLQALGVLKFISDQTSNLKNRGNLLADIFEIEPQNLIRAIRLVHSEDNNRDASRTEENLEVVENFLKKYSFNDAIDRLKKNQ